METCAYPLFFRFRELVVGPDGRWAAGVLFSGRALLERLAEDEWTMASVEPGGIVEAGPTADDARTRFRHAVAHVLFDIAAECNSWTEFHDATMSLLDEPADEPTGSAWDEALCRLRNGECSASDPAVRELQRVRADGSEPHLEVVCLTDALAAGRLGNEVDRFDLAQAAA